MLRPTVVLLLAILVGACATQTRMGGDRAQELVAVASEPDPIPEACARSDLQVHPERSLDVYFDSARTVDQLRDAWPPLFGTVLVELSPDAESDTDRWSVLTDMSSREAVVSIATTFRSARRDTDLPDGETLQIFLGDESEVAPRLVEEFRSCPAEILGDDDVLEQLLAAAGELETEAGLDRVLALHVDPLGRPGTLLYTGAADEKEIVDAENAAVVASARFRPAHVEGIPVDGWIGLADAEPDPTKVREVVITGLEGRLVGRRASSSARPLYAAASYERGDVIPCGGQYGISQFALSCRYNASTGTLIPLEQTTTQVWMGSYDGPENAQGRFDPNNPCRWRAGVPRAQQGC